MALLTGTLLGGWLRAQFNAGSDSEVLMRAAQQLPSSLPEHCGDWRYLSDETLDDDTFSRLHCASYISRLYAHEQTGNEVAVIVLLGSAGPLAAHIAEDCHSPSAFVQAREHTCLEIAGMDGTTHSFRDVEFRSQLPAKGRTRVLYAWSDGNNWKAPAWPRMVFGDRPFLYKLQVVAVEQPSPESDWDASRDFLTHLTPHLQNHLIVARSPK